MSFYDKVRQVTAEKLADRELKFNEKVKRSRGYHIMLDGKLLGSNPTLAGAQRTASNIGPDVTIVKK